MRVPTRESLLLALRQSRDEVIDGVKNLPSDVLDSGRYENGWSARQILAHIASIEWTYPRLIDLAAQPVPDKPAEGGPPRTARGDVQSYNERQVEKRAALMAEELLAEFAKNRDATILAVEGADEALFEIEIQSAGGFRGPLAQVMHWVAVDHVRLHLQDILTDPWGQANDSQSG